MSSFLSQYGFRIYSNDFKDMKWTEFSALLSGLSPDTPLGTVVRIRSEDDPDVIKNFTTDQRRIRSEWRKRQASEVSEDEMKVFLDEMLKAFKDMAGVENDGSK